MGTVSTLWVPGAVRDDTRERGGFTDGDLRLLVAYEKFLASHQIAEKLYCDRCYKANADWDGCRASVTQNGFTALAFIECRCRVLERKGLVS